MTTTSSGPVPASCSKRLRHFMASNRVSPVLTLAAISTLVVSLEGCGGGGGDSTPSADKKCLSQVGLTQQPITDANGNPAPTTPVSGVVHIRITFPSGGIAHGTGVVVNNHNVLTSAHNLIDPQTGRRPLRIDVAEATGNNVEWRTAHAAVTHPRFDLNAPDGIHDYDFGLIFFDEALPFNQRELYTEWNVPTDCNDCPTAQVGVAGAVHHGDAEWDDPITRWVLRRPVLRAANRPDGTQVLFFDSIFGEVGDSGAPAFGPVTAHGQTREVVIGLHPGDSFINVNGQQRQVTVVHTITRQIYADLQLQIVQALQAAQQRRAPATRTITASPVDHEFYSVTVSSYLPTPTTNSTVLEPTNHVNERLAQYYVNAFNLPAAPGGGRICHDET